MRTVGTIFVFLVFSLLTSNVRAQTPDLLVPAPPPVDEVAPEDGAAQPSSREKIIRERLEKNPNDVEALVALADLYVERGQTPQAIAHLQSAIECDPCSCELAIALGKVYIQAECWCCAISLFERLDCSGCHDAAYWLSICWLNQERPLLAFEYACGACCSTRELCCAREIAKGRALAAVGLERQADCFFQAGGRCPEMCCEANKLRCELAQLSRKRSRLQGSVSATQRYDDNPGVVPTSNVFGVATGPTPTAANQYYGQVQFDLYRNSNTRAIAGYALLHTSNYRASRFDLLDNAAFVAATRREMIHGKPVEFGIRADYDYLTVGRNSFLQRGVITPTISLIDSDVTATTLIGRYALADFLGQGAANGTIADIDSDALAIGVLRQRKMLRYNVTLTGGYTYLRNMSDGGTFDFNGHQIQGGVLWRLDCWDVDVNLTGTIDFRNYDNPLPATGAIRDDVEYRAQFFVRKGLCRDIDLIFGWQFDENASNIAGASYQRNVLDLGVQYNFGGGSSTASRRAYNTY